MTINTIYTEDVQSIGNVVIATDEESVQCIYTTKEGENLFALGHIYKNPHKITLMYNEKNIKTGEMYTRMFEFDPIQLIEAITKVVKIAKHKKEESFI